MDRREYINRVDDLTPEQIVEGILKGIVTFDELRKTGEFTFDKQKIVKALLNKKDDDAYATATTIAELEKYMEVFPSGYHLSGAVSKIQQLRDKEDADNKRRQERERVLSKAKEDINEYTPDEIIDKLSSEVLTDLCIELGIDAQKIINYREPVLKFNDIPQNESDLPEGYTDIFFWGIGSSGKTCALSAIFNTIKRDYAMEAPDCDNKFGATYRDSLINFFKNDGYGYLPARTNIDRTQYMPFLFYKRGEKNKRKISFFELSGEVFQYFYEVVYNTRLIDDDGKRGDIEKSFRTLDLLLKSNNKKIHYFFIDYNQETKHFIDSYGLTQSNYLEAAATYFRDAKDKNNRPVDIFKKKTDAVYVVITKSDEIRGIDKNASANKFLNDNFGSFIEVLENQCKKHSVDFKIKLFSIGDVYFKRICKINRAYSTDIINDLLKRVNPVNDSKIRKFFNG